MFEKSVPIGILRESSLDRLDRSTLAPYGFSFISDTVWTRTDRRIGTFPFQSDAQPLHFLFE